MLSRCGDPVLREEKQVTGGASGPTGAGLVMGATVEVWTCNLGSRTFVRSLEFGNGILVRIETGGYGYDPP